MKDDQEEGKMLNLTNLKTFALLMCPGSPEEKSGYLFDIAYGQVINYEKKHSSVSS